MRKCIARLAGATLCLGVVPLVGCSEHRPKSKSGLVARNNSQAEVTNPPSVSVKKDPDSDQTVSKLPLEFEVYQNKPTSNVLEPFYQVVLLNQKLEQITVNCTLIRPNSKVFGHTKVTVPGNGMWQFLGIGESVFAGDMEGCIYPGDTVIITSRFYGEKLEIKIPGKREFEDPLERAEAFRKSAEAKRLAENKRQEQERMEGPNGREAVGERNQKRVQDGGGLAPGNNELDRILQRFEDQSIKEVGANYNKAWMDRVKGKIRDKMPLTAREQQDLNNIMRFAGEGK
jgi:hypothetical protein